MRIIVFEPDLIFSSRIESAARNIGLDCEIVTSIDDLTEKARHAIPEGLFINLDVFGQRFDVLRDFKERKCLLFGYYSHLRMEIAESAKRAGVNAISRGAFVSGLERVLRSLRT